MEKQFNQILKEQIILEFHQKGLDDLIVFFMAKYPQYPYTELVPEKVLSTCLDDYEISFLASYIRYSDIALLGSSLRDEKVKEKLCFLHLHIGTILPSYRKFIWADDITIEDLKRWLPLLQNFKIKNLLLRCTQITEIYKTFLDHCLDMSSFAYQNLVLVSQLYPNILIETETYVKEIVYKLQALYASGDWHSYISLKRSLFLSIQNHPWLCTKYFTLETLYEDARILQVQIEEWIGEKLPISFIKLQVTVLDKLITLDEELERALTNEEKMSVQYRKKMIQYEPIVGQ